MMTVHIIESFNLRALETWGAVLVIFVLTTTYYACNTLRLRKRRLPPGPLPWPIFGNLFSVGKSLHLSLAQLANRYGNIMCVYLGNIRTIVVSDAKMAKELFSVSDAQFASRPIHNLMYTTSKYVNKEYMNQDCDLALSHYTPKVREMQQILRTELFAPRKLNATTGARREEVGRMVAVVKSSASTWQPVHLRDVLNEFAVRNACRSFFNKAFVDSELSKSDGLQLQDFRKIEEEFKTLFAVPNIFGDACLSVLRPLDLHGLERNWKDFTPRKKKMMTLLLDWYRKQAALPKQLGDHDKLPETDFVEVLFQMSKEGKLSETIIEGLTPGLMLAGSDTVSITLEWAMLELVRHPHVMQRLQSELDGSFEGVGGHMDEGIATQLPYLQAVLKEVLRFHPPTPLAIPHCNTEDAVLAGYNIPAGTTVLANIWAMNRDPAMWGEDATAFNPDRFLSLDAKWSASYGPKFHLLAFSAGRRMCPGRELAMRTLSLALASLVHACEWLALQSVTLTDEENSGGLTTGPKHPTVLRCRPRTMSL